MTSYVIEDLLPQFLLCGAGSPSIEKAVIRNAQDISIQDI